MFSDIGECTIMIVAIEAVLAKVRNVDIRPAVIIEIADGDSEAPALVGDSRLFSYIGERAIAIVVE